MLLHKLLEQNLFNVVTHYTTSTHRPELKLTAKAELLVCYSCVIKQDKFPDFSCNPHKSWVQ